MANYSLDNFQVSGITLTQPQDHAYYSLGNSLLGQAKHIIFKVFKYFNQITGL